MKNYNIVMMFVLNLLLFVIFENYCDAVIFSLNDTEYNRMPALYKLDDYDSCLLEPGGTYCVVDADLFSEGPSELMSMINGYSAHTTKHFNHTQIHRGVCVSRNCLNFRAGNSTLDTLLEACLNESIWKHYEIQAKLSRIHYCNTARDKTRIDTSDIVVAVVYLIIIMLNVIGSFYEVVNRKNIEKSGNPYLLAFSVRRNWLKLTASVGEGGDERLERLKLFHGLRTMTMICVFFSHTVLIQALGYVDNPQYIEKSYEDPLKQILYNGNLVINTFFVMSIFLLTYNFQLHAEKYGVSWILLPKGVLLRWLRLTPTYALILATLCTWMRHIGGGPMWALMVHSEATVCREYWWAHLLYFNNYMYDDAACAPQTWYLAADTQLFCIGLLVCIIARTPRMQKAILLFMILVSLGTVAAHTYFQRLEALVIQSPEKYRNLYSSDDTFRYVYIRGHTNLSSCTLGLAAGFLVHNWQQNGKDLAKYQKYRWLYWLVFPLGVAVILSGGLFYIDGEPPSDALRIIYATFYRTVFQLLIVVLIVATIFKFENLYRPILEWRGFTWSGRVSYSAFLLHTLFQRGLVGAQRQPTFMSDYYELYILVATVFLSYVGAALLWLTVEGPATALVKASHKYREKRDENGTRM